MRSSAKPAAKPAATDPMVGRGMLWLDNDGAVMWQGAIIAALPDGYYLIQLFSWMFGEPTDQIVVHVSTFSVTAPSWNGKPVFYDSPEDMSSAYEARLGPMSEKIRSKLKAEA